MIDLLDELQRDHTNMAALLKILEHQVDLVRKGEPADRDALRGIAEYFCDYPDLCHHPKEDILARRLLAKDADENDILARLPEQHATLSDLTKAFAETVRGAEGATEDPALADAAETFIEAQRRHMEMEERYFFPLARLALSPNDMTDAALELVVREDPLFGHSSEPRFEALRESIMESEKHAG